MAFALTGEQQRAVDSRGGALLVSAAAGSGKTRVLVERLLSRVEGEGLDVDRFLVISYTKASAAELRARIVEELSDRLAQNPKDGHLRRQAALVYKTQISTVHSFCGQLLRECGHLIDLSPDYRLCDEGEAGILALSALEGVLERRYEGIEHDQGFSYLVDTMSAGRDDSKLIQIVLDIRGRIQSHPDPNAWLDQQAKAFDLKGCGDVGETVWGALLLADARRQAIYWLGRMVIALELTTCDEKLSANYAPTLSATIDGLRHFITGCEEGWEGARGALPIPFPTAGRKKMTDCLQEVEQVKAMRNTCKKQFEKLRERFVDSSDDLLEDLEGVRPGVEALVTLVKEFEVAFTQEKTKRNLLDFGDLEHLAVKLLVDSAGAPTQLARQWSERYDEIMVDEYQDTNAVQNTIFSAISKEGKNLFMVGDVKQSIYRFRLADPTIFLEKYRNFASYEEAKEGEPRRIILSQNFRSRGQVLEGTNFILRNIMSTEFGEMDYGAQEALYVGASFEEHPDDPNYHALELNALDLSEAEGEGGTGKPERDLLEARFVAKRIAQMLEEGYQVLEGGAPRTLRTSDVVILLRSPNSVLHHYARALGERDIPLECEGGGDFFATTEISVALSLLQMIDNPRQDIPLLSALRSPVYAFSADRLAQIRAAAPEGDFYSAVVSAGDRGEEDCVTFLKELEELRFGAGDKSCADLLWHLFDSTNLLGLFGTYSEGERRQGNLLALTQVARGFEGAGHKGLFGFLSHLERLRRNGAKLALPTAGRGGGGVRIMSIHRSKGLEFPVVFLCGLARQFNKEDLKRPILFHPKLGVGPKRLDIQRMVEYPTIARRGVARQMEYEMLAEELRVLYVAMTRAKEKLILTCALTGGGKDLEKLASDVQCPVNPQVLLGCSTMAQWILLPAMARPEGYPLRGACGCTVEIPNVDFGPTWDIRWVKREACAQPQWKPHSGAAVVPEGMGISVEDLTKTLQWCYPHHKEVDIPSKITATQIKGRHLDDEAATEAPQPKRPAQFQRPRFAQESMGLTPAQKGTALHLVMQFIDFAKTTSILEVQGEIDRLIAQEFITPQQGEVVSAKKIATFFASPIGRHLRGHPKLRREFKFSILVPASDYYSKVGEGERVLLQGVVDCFFEDEDGITVVDFKTDWVTAQTIQGRAENYRPQLSAYGHALEEMTGKRVVRHILWFFAMDCGVEV